MFIIYNKTILRTCGNFVAGNRTNQLKSPILFTGLVLLIAMVSSCRKDYLKTPTTGFATLGLFEVDSSIYKDIYIPITQIGAQNAKTYYGRFDTGSSGMTMDAHGLLPDSMITENGIRVAGDSVDINGITVTSQEATISYGDATGGTYEYGNLAYAPITLGVPGETITTKRIPFFLYHKIIDSKTGRTMRAHSNDVFGVGPGFSFANKAIGSPLSYFGPVGNVSGGFKLARLNRAAFSVNGTYVAALLTIGLTPADLNSSGYIMHNLSYYSFGGYSPDIPSIISYGGKHVPAFVLFDTGTPAISTIENEAAKNDATTLPANTLVIITTNNGFNYKYRTGDDINITQLANPSYTHDLRTIFGMDFFINNEFLMDYANHRIGLKN